MLDYLLSLFPDPNMYPEFYLVFITLIPGIELRGSIPVGIALGLDPLFVLAAAILVNLIIIVPTFIFLDLIMPHVEGVWIFGKLIDRIRGKTKNLVDKYGFWGLALFVAIPLPGSGVYSGALAAYLFDIDRVPSYAAIALGAVVAGVLVTGISFGLFSAGKAVLTLI